MFVNYFLGKNIDIIMISRLSGDLKQAAYYNLAFMMISTLALALGAGFMEITLPMLSEIKTRGGEKSLAVAWQIILKAITILCFSAVLFLACNSASIVEVIYSSRYSPAAPLLLVYAAFYAVLYLLGGGLNTSTLYILNQEKKILTIRLVTGLLNFALNLLFIPRWGALGAVIATGGSTLLAVGWEVTLVRKMIGIKYPFSFLFKLVAAALGGALGGVMIPGTGIISLLLRALLYILIMGLILYLLKPLNNRDQRLLEQAHPWLGRLGNKFMLKEK